MLKIIVKSFKELTLTELYNLLQLRSEVFVVEQDCVYQDIDGKDPNALHILGYLDIHLVAYTRIFKPGDYFNTSSIGRVVVAKHKRDYNFGYKIMQASIDTINTNYKCTEITISAQTYLIKFYNNLGFIEVGEPYLEDDIPHIKMVFN